MSQTHDLIFQLEHAVKSRKRNLVRENPHAGRLALPDNDSGFEPEDFDDEQITGLTAEQVKAELRSVKTYATNKKGK